MEDGMHQIGEVAEAVGLSLRTIRHYEDVGVAPPSGRSAGGFRLYTDDDIERLRMVKRMKALDLSLDEMRQLLDARDRLAEGRGGERARAELRERMAMFAELARERCRELRAQLDAAEEIAALLRREASPARARAGRAL